MGLPTGGAPPRPVLPTLAGIPHLEPMELARHTQWLASVGVVGDLISHTYDRLRAEQAAAEPHAWRLGEQGGPRRWPHPLKPGGWPMPFGRKTTPDELPGFGTGLDPGESARWQVRVHRKCGEVLEGWAADRGASCVRIYMGAPWAAWGPVMLPEAEIQHLDWIGDTGDSVAPPHEP